MLARWQEFVGTGELMKSIEDKVGRIRDRLVSAATGRPQPAQQLHARSRVRAADPDHRVRRVSRRARRLGMAFAAGWSAAARAVGCRPVPRVAGLPRPGRPAPSATGRQGVLDLVRDEGSDRRATARFLAYGVNGLGVALMMVVFSHSAGLTGAEVVVAGGTALVGQRILEAVFGDQTVRRLVETARKDLDQRIERELWQPELQRYLDLLDVIAVPVGCR